MKAKRFILMLLVMLMGVTGAWAQQTFIKDVKVSAQSTDGGYNNLIAEGYTVAKESDGTYFDFNGGGTGGDYVYIGYKTTTDPHEAISDLAILYHVPDVNPNFGSDVFLEGGSEIMMIEGKRYYLAPHSASSDMNNGNTKHNSSVYLYYTRVDNITDGTKILTEIGGLSLRSQEPTVPDGWDSMIHGYTGYKQPTAEDGTQYYEFEPEKESPYGDTNKGGGGYDSYITCNYWTAKAYTVTFDNQGGVGLNNINAIYTLAMPQITIPTREDYAFTGYFSRPNGGGTKYYNADGTSAHVWDIANNTTLYAQWELGRPHYIDADGSKKYVTDYTLINDESTAKTLSSGWYIVLGENVQTSTLVCKGDVNIILADDAKLTTTGASFDAGIRVVDEGASLAIYGQQNQTGQLITTGGFFGAGIGGGNNGSGQNITINGGVITAIGGDCGAGIGGGNYGNGNNITINGGVITAIGGERSQAIGRGDMGSASNIFINAALALYADGNNPPTTSIEHASGEDVSSSLSGKRYAIARIPVQGVTITLDMKGGIGGTEQVTADEGKDMPTITVPTLEGLCFNGYYAEPNGGGTKYYNADGTSAHLWPHAQNTTLYAYWKQAVSYIDVDGTEKYACVYEEITTTNTVTELNSGWYIVNGEDVKTSTLVCKGDVHLILADGAKLTATGAQWDAGIRVVDEGASLAIYGQQNQTGQLIATGNYLGAGIGGTYNTSGHNITINGGIITACGGANGTSGIGSPNNYGSSNIFINSSLVLYADGNNPPTTIINHTTGVDVSSKLSGKQYAIVRTPVQGITVTLDKQGGTGGDNLVTANEYEDMPTITVPTLEGLCFNGYYAEPNGGGTKYYNADGTSAHLWNKDENATLYAYWKQAVSYIDVDGTEKYAGVYEEITTTNTVTELNSGWYIVNGEDVQTSTLVCKGDVHLILADDAKLTATGAHWDAGIRVVDEGVSLTIYGQTEQSGQLIATGGFKSAGIGGGINGSGHDITINGGVITATGGHSGAGIGGGNCGNGHNITINGGVITATGLGDAAGIGGGDYASSSYITINGGEISATCSGTGGSAIGGGWFRNSSNIHINSALILKADNETTPITEIEHISSEDLSDALYQKLHATLALPTVAVKHVPDTEENYGTFYHKCADYTVPNEDAEIYTAAVEEYQGETCLVLHKIEGGVIPANTAVILRTTESSTIDLQPCADASGITLPANSLSGANLPEQAPANCYIMSYGQDGFGFYKYAEGKDLAAHKAYLTYERPAGAPARALRMVFADDEVDGIENVNVNENENVSIYSLSGIRLNKLQKGINIVNGKKVIVR